MSIVCALEISTCLEAVEWKTQSVSSYPMVSKQDMFSYTIGELTLMIWVFEHKQCVCSATAFVDRMSELRSRITTEYRKRNLTLKLALQSS